MEICPIFLVVSDNAKFHMLKCNDPLHDHDVDHLYEEWLSHYTVMKTSQATSSTMA